LVRPSPLLDDLSQKKIRKADFEKALEKTEGLPSWMKWRFLDQLYEGKWDGNWRWQQLFQELEKDSLQSETVRLFHLWNQPFLPTYTNDEWAQICPSEVERKRYQLHVEGKGQGDLLCFYHKNPIEGQPFFRPLAYYPAFDHFVYDTKVAFCSPHCCKNYIQETKEIKYQDVLVDIQVCATRRWNYPFHIQCAPPVSILPCFSDIQLIETKKKVNDSAPPRNDLVLLKRMLVSKDFIPPRNEREFQLCLSMNSSVFQFVFPPFAVLQHYLYPCHKDIYPFSNSDKSIKMGIPQQF
jgi:hypothetical protein